MRRSNRSPVVALVLSGVAACGGNEPADDGSWEGGDFLAGTGSSVTGALAVAGPWEPAADVKALAETFQFSLQDAPPYDGGANCSGGATPGATALRSFLLQAFPQTSGIGIYNCRVIAGTNTMSLHGVGRALDVMIPTVGGDADNGKGDPIGAWLLTHAAEIGIQRVIWDHRIWGVDRHPHFHDLVSSNPHIDHLHVELNEAGAAKQTPWFQSAPTVPPPPACAPLPPGENILENGDDCLALLGPERFWRTESVGHGGDLAWTNAYSGSTPSNEARWTLLFSQPGRYHLAAWIDDTYGVYAHARYVVHASGSEHVVEVDQGAASGWVELGAYDFSGTGTEDLRLADNAGTTVPSDQHIVVDALRITPEAPPPDETEVTAPDAGATTTEQPPPDAGVTAPSPDAGVDGGASDGAAPATGPVGRDAGTRGTGDEASVGGAAPGGTDCSAAGGSPAVLVLAALLVRRRRAGRAP